MPAEKFIVEDKNMKRVILLFAILFLTGTVHGAFEDYGWGVRAMALGGAYVSLADDAAGPFYNPAGLVKLEKMEASFMYAGLLTGIDMEAISVMQSGFVMKQNFGAVGINWARFSVDSLYSEDLLILTYANTLNKIDSSLDETVHLGVNIKLYKNQYNMYDDSISADPVFGKGDSATAIGGDIGCLIDLGTRKRFEDTYRLGISVLNLNQPNVGIKQTDKVPMQIKGGFFYPLPVAGSFMEDISINRSLVCFSITYVDETDINVHIGLENNFFGELLKFRLGGNLNEFGTGLGIRYALKKIDLLIDYTFVYPFKISDTSGNHRTALSVRF